MVRAVLDGRKSQTRRVIDWKRLHKQAGLPFPTKCKLAYYTMMESWGINANDGMQRLVNCPYGKKGDRLWVTMTAPSWKGKTVEERFWQRVIKTEDCWEWMGVTGKNKYGQIKIGQKTIPTHRFSYALHFGEIPEGLHVMHICDKPWCVNPDHLKTGTNADNCADKSKKGRTVRKFGQDNRQSKLSDCDVRKICELYNKGYNQKYIANKFGLSQGQISKIVTGSRRSKSGIYLPPYPTGLRTLEITDIRVERVHDISEEDAKAEGIKDVSGGNMDCPERRKKYHAIMDHDWGQGGIRGHYKFGFHLLWDSINKKRGYGWETNPYVWVVEFKRI